MKKIIKKFRKHINNKKLETSTICGVLIIVSSLQLVTLFRDALIQKILPLTHSDTLVKMLYFDKQRDPKLMYALGEYYFGAGTYDLEKAKRYFEKAIELDESLPLAHYQLSRIFFINGDQQNALLEINKELEYHPDFKRSYYIRGLIHGYTNQLPLAAEDFTEFLKWKPNSWAAYNDLAWVYFQQGDFQKSYDTANKGLEYAPNNPWLLNTVGISLKNLNQPVAAKQAFKQALLSIQNLTPKEWGRAYPGNDPVFYTTGLSNMEKTVTNNLLLLESNQKLQ